MGSYMAKPMIFCKELTESKIKNLAATIMSVKELFLIFAV